MVSKQELGLAIAEVALKIEREEGKGTEVYWDFFENNATGNTSGYSVRIYVIHSETEELAGLLYLDGEENFGDNIEDYIYSELKSDILKRAKKGKNATEDIDDIDEQHENDISELIDEVDKKFSRENQDLQLLYEQDGQAGLYLNTFNIIEKSSGKVLTQVAMKDEELTSVDAVYDRILEALKQSAMEDIVSGNDFDGFDDDGGYDTAEEDVEDNTLSIQAQNFLASHYQYTEIIRKFESEFISQKGIDIKDDNDFKYWFKDFLDELIDVDSFEVEDEHSYGDEYDERIATWYGELDGIYGVDKEVTSVEYIEQDDKVKLLVKVKLSADVILQGDDNDIDRTYTTAVEFLLDVPTSEDELNRIYEEYPTIHVGRDDWDWE